MIFQDDPILNDGRFKLEDGGCGILGMAHLGVRHGGYLFNRNTFLEDCEFMRSRDYLLHNCTILDWNKVAENFNLDYEIVIEKGTHKLPAARTLKDGEIQLLFLYNPKTGYRHFVEGDKYDNVGYDGLKNSVTTNAYKAGTAYIESRRVFRRKK